MSRETWEAMKKKMLPQDWRSKNEYQGPVLDLLEELETTVEIEYEGRGFNEAWEDEKAWETHRNQRNYYQVTIKRNKREYSFRFWDSIHNSEKYEDEAPARRKVSRKIWYLKRPRPVEYDVLSCLTWYKSWDCFEDFASDLGYDTDNRKALEVFLAVEREHAGLTRLFNEEEREKLSEVCG